MTTKLEQLLGWMDSAEYAPTYGELREKVKDLISEEQQVQNCLMADVGETCEHDYKPLGCGFDKICVKCDKKVSIE